MSLWWLTGRRSASRRYWYSISAPWGLILTLIALVVALVVWAVMNVVW